MDRIKKGKIPFIVSQRSFSFVLPFIFFTKYISVLLYLLISGRIFFFLLQYQTLQYLVSQDLFIREHFDVLRLVIQNKYASLLNTLRKRSPIGQQLYHPKKILLSRFHIIFLLLELKVFYLYYKEQSCQCVALSSC